MVFPNISLKASADVAELSVTLGKIIVPKNEEHHIMNISAKKVITLEEFFQMFYSSGDGTFCIANISPCTDNAEGILASPWGKIWLNGTVLNFNKLGGESNVPGFTNMAYAYTIDLNRDFYPQFEIIGRWERDLCARSNSWSVGSRITVEKQLYNLAFVSEKSNNSCVEVSCAKKWNEVVKTLLDRNIQLNKGDYVGLTIVIIVRNGNLKTKPCYIRIRYTVMIGDYLNPFDTRPAVPLGCPPFGPPTPPYTMPPAY